MNREYGSDFHYIQPVGDYQPLAEAGKKISLFFTGRVALYNLLSFGIKKYGWSKVAFPSYYCHEVVDFCRRLPVDIGYYEYNPTYSEKTVSWVDEESSVFINVDYFGIKKLDTDFVRKGVVIDDVTHNLHSLGKGNADYYVGSLRKQLPVAVGGFCFSKKNDFSFVIGETDTANQIAMQKLTAMWLKSAYLEGSFAQKDIFRSLYIEAENRFGLESTNSILPKIIETQLYSLPITTLLERTNNNVVQAKKGIKLSQGVRLMEMENTSDMGLVFLADNHGLRTKFKDYLVDNKIYPAVLWPNQFIQSDVDLEERILFVHVDFRYSKDDIGYIISIINKFFENV